MNIPSAKEAREKVQNAEKEAKEILLIAQRKNIEKTLRDAIRELKYFCDIEYFMLHELISELTEKGYSVIELSDSRGHRISWQ